MYPKMNFERPGVLHIFTTRLTSKHVAVVIVTVVT